jgi:predicted amidohydrolase YtcJ
VVPNPDPWLGLQGLVTRRDPTGQFPGALWPEQALPLEAALAAYTINPARAMRIDDETGSLEAGKSADFVVLDRHLFQVPADTLAQTKVQATVFEGRVVHGSLE